MKWTQTTSSSNVVIHCRHKNLYFVGVALFTTLSLLINNYMVATIGIQFSDIYVVNVDQTNKDSSTTTTYAIFYNAYVNPANVYHSHGIISEQLMQWQQSRYANSTLYYTHLGDSTLQLPCLNNKHCKLLQQKSDGWEEETLSKLQEYCQSNPNHNVIYIHSKGTYTSNAINDRLRNLITLSALSDECYDGLNSEQCNVCSARFSPLPHWHTPGNMWTAKCSYIAQLYPIQYFEPKVLDIIETYKKNCSDCANETDPSSVGAGRFANEHWVHTHPHVLPCDVFPDTSYMYGYGIPDNTSINFSLDMAPRDYRHIQGFINFVHGVLGPPIRLTYRLYELHELYNTTPFNDSFVWTWYKNHL